MPRRRLSAPFTDEETDAQSDRFILHQGACRVKAELRTVASSIPDPASPGPHAYSCLARQRNMAAPLTSPGPVLAKQLSHGVPFRGSLREKVLGARRHPLGRLTGGQDPSPAGPEQGQSSLCPRPWAQCGSGLTQRSAVHFLSSCLSGGAETSGHSLPHSLIHCDRTQASPRLGWPGLGPGAADPALDLLVLSNAPNAGLRLGHSQEKVWPTWVLRREQQVTDG